MGLFLGQFIPAVSNIWDGIHHRCFSFFFQNRVREKKILCSCICMVTTAEYIYLSYRSSKPCDNIDLQEFPTIGDLF